MSELELPTTRYARSGDISVAYQTMGHGSIDLILVLGVVSHVEFMHEIPGWTEDSRLDGFVAPPGSVCAYRNV